MPAEPGDSPLAALGFSPEAQRLYGIVLRNPGAAAADLGWTAGLSGDALDHPLLELVDAALVRREGDRLVAEPAEVSVGRLIFDQVGALRAQREELDRARRNLSGYAAQHSASDLGIETFPIEVIPGRDVVGLLRGLAATAPGDMLYLRPDQWRYDDGRRADEVIKDLLGEGRTSRVIYPARVLEEAPAVVRDRAEAGERVRVLASVPTRLAVLGTTVALIPQRFGGDAERVLVIRQESMIAALRHWFEALWERALPIPGLEAESPSGSSGRRLLLDQLVTGAKDEQIARAMGLSLRTVRRRTSELMSELGVESRFQAGAEAVRRGWL